MTLHRGCLMQSSGAMNRDSSRHSRKTVKLQSVAQQQKIRIFRIPTAGYTDLLAIRRCRKKRGFLCPTRKNQGSLSIRPRRHRTLDRQRAAGVMADVNHDGLCMCNVMRDLGADDLLFAAARSEQSTRKQTGQLSIWPTKLAGRKTKGPKGADVIGHFWSHGFLSKERLPCRADTNESLSQSGTSFLGCLRNVIRDQAFVFGILDVCASDSPLHPLPPELLCREGSILVIV